MYILRMLRLYKGAYAAELIKFYTGAAKAHRNFYAVWLYYSDMFLILLIREQPHIPRANGEKTAVSAAERCAAWKARGVIR